MFLKNIHLNPLTMNRALLLLALLIGMGPVYGQAGQIIGYWLTEDGDSQIEIFKKADQIFAGRIVWLEEPLEADGKPKLDNENPDKALQDRHIVGLEMLDGFSFDPGSNEWAGGKIYDPKNGRTYSAYIRLDGNNTLKLKGYVMGMRFLGRQTTWTREARKREDQ